MMNLFGSTVKILWICVIVSVFGACRSETVTSGPPVSAPVEPGVAPIAASSYVRDKSNSPLHDVQPSDKTENSAPVLPDPVTTQQPPNDPPEKAVENLNLEWVERVTGGADPEAPLPLIVAVHGLGDKPETFIRVFEGLQFPARVVAPRAPTRYGNGYSWFPIGAKALNQEALVDGLEDAAEQVTLWAARMIRKRPTVGKPILTGYSQGGLIAFAAAAKYPALFQAIYPISGLLPASMLPEAVDDRSVLPRVRAFHGEADTRVPYAEASKAIAKLVSLGYDASIRSYPNVPHRLTAAMWQDLLTELRSHAVSDNPHFPPAGGTNRAD
ncbi:MAG: alpha/beta fold hydrolase [Myxococcales bacterium]|nr:alpha/beta fold hydrolase [Myxococcales bacterium]